MTGQLSHRGLVVWEKVKALRDRGSKEAKNELRVEAGGKEW